MTRSTFPSRSRADGMVLGVYRGGYVTFENLEADDEPRHMVGLSREKLLEIMAKLARGDLSALEPEPWKSGY